jgi:hypothetical protein
MLVLGGLALAEAGGAGVFTWRGRGGTRAPATWCGWSPT